MSASGNAPVSPPDPRPVVIRPYPWPWQPGEIASGLVALLLVLLMPFLYQVRTKAAAKPEPFPVREVIGGEVLPGYVPVREEIRVHVVGAVHDPGVVDLRWGGRVEEAIRLAGGATAEADLARLNLAAILTDGEQLVVPRLGEESAPEAMPVVRSLEERIRLNHCTAAELEVIPGIGPVLAQEIIDYRLAHGPYMALTDLQEIPGIGARKMATIARYVRLD